MQNPPLNPLTDNGGSLDLSNNPNPANNRNAAAFSTGANLEENKGKLESAKVNSREVKQERMQKSQQGQLEMACRQQVNEEMTKVTE